MLKRLDHVGVIVDDLDEASRFLAGMGLQHDRDIEIPGRLKASSYSCGDAKVEVIEIIEPGEPLGASGPGPLAQRCGSRGEK